tara:strand:+ start:961 stop:1668 length:708 start_codon:yes stop_codon:yes gene_type:complete
MIKNLLVTNNSNTKIRKSANGSGYKIGSLSMAPDDLICPNRKVAMCDVDCLFKSGRGAMETVQKARRAKTKLWHKDRDQFLDILFKDIERHIKSSNNAGLIPAVRLNVISDIAWESYGIFDKYPELVGYDYTKRPERLGNTPDNYQLMFSYSGAPEYQGMVAEAFKTEIPVSAVFRGGFPSEFMGREVIDGDLSDLFNLAAKNKVVGLKLKGGKDIQLSNSPFIVDNPELVRLAA